MSATITKSRGRIGYPDDAFLFPELKDAEFLDEMADEIDGLCAMDAVCKTVVDEMVVKDAEFESEHPRDAHGEFTHKDRAEMLSVLDGMAAEYKRTGEEVDSRFEGFVKQSDGDRKAARSLADKDESFQQLLNHHYGIGDERDKLAAKFSTADKVLRESEKESSDHAKQMAKYKPKTTELKSVMSKVETAMASVRDQLRDSILTSLMKDAPENRKAAIQRKAERLADESFAEYVFKLTGKIAEASEGKTVTAVEHKGNSDIWGWSTLTAKLSDGSSINLETKQIINVSSLGKLFNQWPTRIQKSEDDVEKAWDESEHPRNPAGSERGGEFVAAGAISGGSSNTGGFFDREQFFSEAKRVWPPEFVALAQAIVDKGYTQGWESGLWDDPQGRGPSLKAAEAKSGISVDDAMALTRYIKGSKNDTYNDSGDSVPDWAIKDALKQGFQLPQLLPKLPGVKMTANSNGTSTVTVAGHEFKQCKIVPPFPLPDNIPAIPPEKTIWLSEGPFGRYMVIDTEAYQYYTFKKNPVTGEMKYEGRTDLKVPNAKEQLSARTPGSGEWARAQGLSYYSGGTAFDRQIAEAHEWTHKYGGEDKFEEIVNRKITGALPTTVGSAIQVAAQLEAIALKEPAPKLDAAALIKLTADGINPPDKERTATVTRKVNDVLRKIEGMTLGEAMEYAHRDEKRLRSERNKQFDEASKKIDALPKDANGEIDAEVKAAIWDKLTNDHANMDRQSVDGVVHKTLVDALVNRLVPNFSKQPWDKSNPMLASSFEMTGEVASYADNKFLNVQLSQANEWLWRHLYPGAYQAMAATKTKIELRPSQDEHDRAYYTQETISLWPGNGASVIVHEYGHHLEKVLNTVAYSREFVNARALPNTVSMRRLTGSKSYREDEVAQPDRFVDAYVGKKYEYDATEVVSMGLQNMAENPAYFYKKDREHFFFTLYLMWGGMARRTDINEVKVGKDADFEAEHPRQSDGEFAPKGQDANRVDKPSESVHTGGMEEKPTLKYPGAKTRRQDPNDYFFISTGAKNNFYTLRHCFTEATYTKGERGTVDTGSREREYHLQNLSTDKETAIKQAEALTGLKLSAEFDVMPIGEKRPVDWSIFQGGKYVGQSIHEVRESDPNYLIWIAENQSPKSGTYGGTVELIQSLMAHELKGRADVKQEVAANAAAKRAAVAEKYKPLVRDLIGGIPGEMGEYSTWRKVEDDERVTVYASDAFTDSTLVHDKKTGEWRTPFGKFVLSVAAGLLNGEAPRGRGLDIMLDIMSKAYGRRNSAGYNKRMEELNSIFNDEKGA